MPPSRCPPRSGRPLRPSQRQLSFAASLRRHGQVLPDLDAHSSARSARQHRRAADPALLVRYISCAAMRAIGSGQPEKQQRDTRPKQRSPAGDEGSSGAQCLPRRARCRSRQLPHKAFTSCVLGWRARARPRRGRVVVDYSRTRTAGALSWRGPRSTDAIGMPSRSRKRALSKLGGRTSVPWRPAGLRQSSTGTWVASPSGHSQWPSRVHFASGRFSERASQQRRRRAHVIRQQRFRARFAPRRGARAARAAGTLRQRARGNPLRRDVLALGTRTPQVRAPYPTSIRA